VFGIRRLGDRFSWFEGLNVGVVFSCCVRQISFLYDILFRGSCLFLYSFWETPFIVS
jgi:hypothetical protein